LGQSLVCNIDHGKFNVLTTSSIRKHIRKNYPSGSCGFQISSPCMSIALLDFEYCNKQYLQWQNPLTLAPYGQNFQILTIEWLKQMYLNQFDTLNQSCKHWTIRTPKPYINLSSIRDKPTLVNMPCLSKIKAENVISRALKCHIIQCFKTIFISHA
jgi:hypothetical protein